MLGSEWSEMYPAPVRIASWLIDSDRLVFDPISEWIKSKSRPQNPGGAAPAIQVGSIIRSRRRWYVSKDWGLEDSFNERFLNLCQWRTDCGASAEIFLKTKLFEEDTEGLEDPGARAAFFEERRSNKPQYIDLDSRLMIEALPRFLRRRQLSYIEEALPGAEDGPRALETVIELGRRDAQPFGSLEGVYVA